MFSFLPCLTWVIDVFFEKLIPETRGWIWKTPFALWKPHLIFKLFLLYPWKFQAKQVFTPRTSHNCVIPLGKFKTPRNSTWFFLDHTLEIPLFHDWPLKIPYPQLPLPPPLPPTHTHARTLVWVFSGIAHSIPSLSSFLISLMVTYTLTDWFRALSDLPTNYWSDTWIRCKLKGAICWCVERRQVGS